MCIRRGSGKQQTLCAATHAGSHSRGVARAAVLTLSPPASVTELKCSLQPTDASVIRAKFIVKTLSRDHDSLLTSECVNKTLTNSSTTTRVRHDGGNYPGESETVCYKDPGPDNVRESTHPRQFCRHCSDCHGAVVAEVVGVQPVNSRSCDTDTPDTV